MSLASDEADAKALVPEVVSREYEGDLDLVHHYEFQPHKKADGSTEYEMTSYLYND